MLKETYNNKLTNNIQKSSLWKHSVIELQPKKEVIYTSGVFKIFAKPTAKHMYRGLFLKK